MCLFFLPQKDQRLARNAISYPRGHVTRGNREKNFFF